MEEDTTDREIVFHRSSLFLSIALFLCGNALAASLEKANQLYFEGKSEKALEAYRELWNQEKSTEAVLNAAFIAAELGDPQESTRLLEEAARNGGSQSAIDFELGWLYANLGEWERSGLVLLTNKDSSDVDSLANLLQARLYLHQKDNASARRLLNELIKKSPKFTLAHYLLGKTYEEDGQTDSAIASYERVLKEDSHFIEVRPLLAPLFEQKKKIDDAWRQYARMFAADSKNAKAKEGMSRLASRITKKPEEIVPPKRIASHTAVEKVLDRERLPKIRIGIGTTSGGDPSLKKSLVFRTSKPFVFWDPETNKETRTGAALSTYTVRLDATDSFAEILDSSGRPMGRFKKSILIRQKDTDPTTTILNSLEFAPNTSWGGLADKEIRGDIEVTVNTNRKSLVVVNHLSIEEYLYGVLAAEMPTHWPIEALKAQAVIARTQAMYRKGLHGKFGYDVCDEQHCQVYTGVAVESKKVREAVDGTKGEYLVYNGRPAHTVFSSNCGGITQTGGQAGWGDTPYWQSAFDGKEPARRPESLAALRRWLQKTPPAYCESSKYTWHPEYRWTRVVMPEDIAAKISRKRDIGRIKKIQILERNASGRVQKLRFVGSKDNITLTKEHEIRKYPGLGSLRSTLFVMDTVFKDGTPESFIFSGGGWGHGVGFCQSGAAGRAESGENYSAILKAYFPTTAIK